MATRALIFSLSYYPFVGGAEVAVRETTDRIDPLDIEFSMVTMRAKGTSRHERIGNIDVYRVGFKAEGGILLSLNKYLYPFLAALKASSLHRSRKFDMVWSIMASFAGFAALFWKHFNMDVPFLLTLQEGDPIEYIVHESMKVKLGPIKIPVQKVMRPVFRSIFVRADRIQAISKHLADFGKSQGATCEAVIVPNGVDIEAFSREIPISELEAFAQNLGVGPDETLLVTASRLVHKNAVTDIIAALEFLPPDVKLLVLGDGELRPELEAQVKRMKLGERVLFKGYIGHEDLPRYLQASDIFIRPSLSEGFGNSFIEAMAARLPVIATRVGGIVDFLRDKETGLFCEVHSPDDIARKVEIYLHDKNLRDEIVDNAFKMVKERYDWSLVARDMKEKVFDQLLKQ